jgi:hypothetical protein
MRKGVFPYAFIRRVSEGGYNFSQDYVYNQQRGEVTTQKKDAQGAGQCAGHAQRVLLRPHLRLRNAKPGDEFTIETVPGR